MRCSLLLWLFVSLNTSPVNGQSPTGDSVLNTQRSDRLESLKSYGVDIKDDIRRAAFYAAVQSLFNVQQKESLVRVQRPMSKAKLLDIENMIRQGSDTESKVFALELAIEHGVLSVKQLRHLIQLVSPGSTLQSRLVINAYERLTNPEDAYQLADLISDAKSRAAFLKKIRTVSRRPPASSSMPSSSVTAD